MTSYDKVDSSSVEATATCQSVPAGSTHTTCKTIFNLANSEQMLRCVGTESLVEMCFSCRRKRTSSRQETANRNNNPHMGNPHYFELVPSLPSIVPQSSSLTHINRCSSKAIADGSRSGGLSATVTTQRLVSAIEQGMTTIFTPFRTVRLTVKSVFAVVCLLVMFSSFCVDGAPAARRTRTNNQDLSSLDVEANLTLFEQSKTQVGGLANTDADPVSSSIDIPLTKTKRSSGGRKARRRRKGGKNKGKKNRRKQGRNKKNRKQKEPRLSPEVIRTKPHHQPDILNSPRRQRLYNDVGNSFHLAVWPNGTVSGEDSNTRSSHSILEIRAVGKNGTVTIMGATTKKYICVSKRGAVQAKKKYKKSRCNFREKILENNQNTYEALSCKGCYLKLNKRGKVTRLKKTNPNKKQAHFLPRSDMDRPRFLASTRGEVLTIDISKMNQTDTDMMDSLTSDITATESDLAVPVNQQNNGGRRKPKRTKSRHTKRTRKSSKRSKTVNISHVAQESSAHDGPSEKETER